MAVLERDNGDLPLVRISEKFCAAFAASPDIIKTMNSRVIVLFDFIGDAMGRLRVANGERPQILDIAAREFAT